MVLSLWMIPRLTPLPPLLPALLNLVIRALTLDVFIRLTDSSVTTLSTRSRARAVCVCTLPTSALPREFQPLRTAPQEGGGIHEQSRLCCARWHWCVGPCARAAATL